ncbi:hypothetical protein RB595_010091 [Gaeumannomyces hyphopodioides]
MVLVRFCGVLQLTEETLHCLSTSFIYVFPASTMRSSWNLLHACSPSVPILGLLCLLLPFCCAGLAFTNDQYHIAPGVSFELSWTGNEGPVTVDLVSVVEKSIVVVQNVTVNDSHTSITWTPPKSVPIRQCLFRIKDTGGNLDYSRALDFKKTGSLSSTLFTDTAPSPTANTSYLPTARNTAMPTLAAETGLSTGEKVGIGIGVAAVPLLLLAAFLVFLSSRRRRRQQQQQRRRAEQEARSSHRLDSAVRSSKAGSTRTTSSCATTDIASDCSCCSAAAPAAGPVAISPSSRGPPLTRMPVLSAATTAPLRKGGVAVGTPAGSPLSAVARAPRALRARATDGGGFYASVPAAESVDPFEDVISPVTPQLATAGWKQQQQQQQQQCGTGGALWPPQQGGEWAGRPPPAGRWAAAGRQCLGPLAELEARANLAQVESVERPWSRRGEAWRRQQAVESPVLGRARLDTPSLYSQDGGGL